MGDRSQVGGVGVLVELGGCGEFGRDSRAEMSAGITYSKHQYVLHRLMPGYMADDIAGLGSPLRRFPYPSVLHAAVS